MLKIKINPFEFVHYMISFYQNMCNSLKTFYYVMTNLFKLCKHTKLSGKHTSLRNKNNNLYPTLIFLYFIQAKTKIRPQEIKKNNLWFIPVNNLNKAELLVKIIQ
jgi:hypothetical protein